MHYSYLLRCADDSFYVGVAATRNAVAAKASVVTAMYTYDGMQKRHQA